MQEKEQDQDAGVGNLGEDSDKIGAGRACHQTRVTDEYDLDRDSRSQEAGVKVAGYRITGITSHEVLK